MFIHQTSSNVVKFEVNFLTSFLTIDTIELIQLLLIHVISLYGYRMTAHLLKLCFTLVVS